jgi:membrane protein YqaA with SNARE-associated domain
MIDLLSDPKIWALVVGASILGAFARLANYYAGLRGKEVIEKIYPQIEPERWQRILRLYERLGKLPLLISSIPIIGTLLTVGAGMAGISRNSFLFWVAFSKIIRNWILVAILWYLF